MRLPEGEETEKGAERLFEEMMVENFPNLMKTMNINIQESQQTPRKINSKRTMMKHIVVKYQKIKTKRIWKAAREKQIITYKRTSIRLSAFFSSETFETGRQWVDTVKVLTVKTLPTKNSIYSKTILQK